MAESGALEVMRTPANSGVAGPVDLPSWARTLIVYNPLSKPLFLTFDGRTPILPSLAAGGTRSLDVGVPGAAILTFPLPVRAGEQASKLSALMDNSAPTAADSGYEAVFYVVDVLLPPATSALA